MVVRCPSAPPQKLVLAQLGTKWFETCVGWVVGCVSVVDAFALPAPPLKPYESLDIKAITVKNIAGSE